MQNWIMEFITSLFTVQKMKQVNKDPAEETTKVANSCFLVIAQDINKKEVLIS